MKGGGGCTCVQEMVDGPARRSVLVAGGLVARRLVRAVEGEGGGLEGGESGGEGGGLRRRAHQGREGTQIGAISSLSNADFKQEEHMQHTPPRLNRALVACPTLLHMGRRQSDRVTE